MRRGAGPSRDAADEPHRLTASLAAVASRLGIPAAAPTVFGQWEEVVGPTVAGHCRPRRLEGGVLEVVCDQGAWAAELRRLSPEIVAQLRALCGPAAPQQVVVRVGQLPTAPASTGHSAGGRGRRW